MLIGFFVLFFSVVQFFLLPAADNGVRRGVKRRAEVSFVEQAARNAAYDMHQRYESQEFWLGHLAAAVIGEYNEQQKVLYASTGTFRIPSPECAARANILGEASKERHNDLVLRRLLQLDIPLIEEAMHDNLELAVVYSRVAGDTLAKINPLNEKQKQRWVTASERLAAWSLAIQAVREEVAANCI